MPSRPLSTRFLLRLATALVLAGATAASAGTTEMPPTAVTATPLRFPPLSLGVVTFPNGKALNLTVGVSGGAFHHPADAPGRIWLVTNRGPSIACARARALVGMEPAELCDGDEKARLLLLPGFVPTIYGVDLGAEAARVVVTLPLKGRSGRPLTGLANPLESALTVRSFDVAGHALPGDPSAIDPGALVKTEDGGFWIADQQASSLVRVAADGTVMRRIVPDGLAAELSGADYQVSDGLPAVFARRAPGHGFQSLAISPDERFLYAATEQPFSGGDGASGNGASGNGVGLLRILKLDLSGARKPEQFAYRLDGPAAFRKDNLKGVRAQTEVRLSEAVAVGPDTLLMLERIDRTARIFRIDLAGAEPLPADVDAADSPAPETLPADALASRGITPVSKRLVLDSDDVGAMPRRLAGLAVLSDTAGVIVNDNESGVDGAEFKLVRLLFPTPILR